MQGKLLIAFNNSTEEAAAFHVYPILSYLEICKWTFRECLAEKTHLMARANKQREKESMQLNISWFLCFRTLMENSTRWTPWIAFHLCYHHRILRLMLSNMQRSVMHCGQTVQSCRSQIFTLVALKNLRSILCVQGSWQAFINFLMC